MHVEPWLCQQVLVPSLGVLTSALQALIAI